ncbi:protein of unknown function [Tissierella praeacuta DSM 18095]|uniref:DUF4364 domain-containing protein n=1 Tax=Tissierella praeacuta DSM 18095 TaxID=1123404 RepID=A0A1M4WTG9_9FIRM|nr:DUF4364 family protein [Tissierella praeacuta]SHE84514.1 protein of unknown function [Tissierella praeacuta DSM 18095]SUP00486.1 Uncharacterised protein [Tissierella praeacuta]
MFIENTEELAQNKLLLLYIIKSSPISFTNSEIIEFVLEKNYMNFFLVQQYLIELVESKFIEIIADNSKEVYIILEKGEIALSYFEDRISSNIKEELNKEFNKIEKKNKIETQVITDYFEKANNQYVVNLKLIENEETLFSLYLDVPTKKQVELICSKWKEAPDFIYQNIINILIDEKATPLE